MEAPGHYETQLRFPVGAEAFGPEEVVLPELAAASEDYSGRVRGIVEGARPAPAETDISLSDGRFLARRLLIRGQTYEAEGSFSVRDVRDFRDPDADPRPELESVKISQARQYRNGAYYPCEAGRALERAVERALAERLESAPERPSLAAA